jgi:threonine synthase
METSDAFDGLRCTDCGERFDADAATHRCPECGGILDPEYDLGALALSRDALEARPFDGDETVVLVNTATGNKEADVLRSHLMSQGI